MAPTRAARLNEEMTPMAQLAEAAANVPEVGFRLEDVVPDVVPDDPKRKRLSGIPAARAKVAKANAALDKAHGKVALLSSDPGLRTQTKKQKQLQKRDIVPPLGY